MTKWIEFVKEFAKKKGMSYKNALKDPECKKEYHEVKGKGLVPVCSSSDSDSDHEQKENVSMKVVIPKEKAKRKSSKKSSGPAEQKEPIEIPQTIEGGGILKAGYTAEAVNGLEHIYPISHDMVLKIVKQLG
jgi:hypothetical protein